MVSREDAHSVSAETCDHVLGLIDCVSCALEPVLTAPHLGGDRRNEEVPASHCAAELPAALDVFVEGLALELGQHIDRVNAAVDEVREGEVDDTVLSCEVDCRFCAVFREKRSPFPPARTIPNTLPCLPVYMKT